MTKQKYKLLCWNDQFEPVNHKSNLDSWMDHDPMFPPNLSFDSDGNAWAVPLKSSKNENILRQNLKYRHFFWVGVAFVAFTYLRSKLLNMRLDQHRLNNLQPFGNTSTSMHQPSLGLKDRFNWCKLTSLPVLWFRTISGRPWRRILATVFANLLRLSRSTSWKIQEVSVWFDKTTSFWSLLPWLLDTPSKNIPLEGFYAPSPLIRSAKRFGWGTYLINRIRTKSGSSKASHQSQRRTCCQKVVGTQAVKQAYWLSTSAHGLSHEYDGWLFGKHCYIRLDLLIVLQKPNFFSGDSFLLNPFKWLINVAGKGERNWLMKNIQSAKLPIDPKVVLPILLPNLTKAPEKVLLGSCRWPKSSKPPCKMYILSKHRNTIM